MIGKRTTSKKSNFKVNAWFLDKDTSEIRHVGGIRFRSGFNDNRRDYWHYWKSYTTGHVRTFKEKTATVSPPDDIVVNI